jgi:hypothetical protein
MCQLDKGRKQKESDLSYTKWRYCIYWTRERTLLVIHHCGIKESMNHNIKQNEQGKPCNRYAIKGRRCLFIITSSQKRQKGFPMCGWRARHRKWWHSVFPLCGECRVVVAGSVFRHSAAILLAELLQRGDPINPHQYVQALKKLEQM